MIIERTYPVKGMSCASCSAHVTKALRNVMGVENVNVNLPMNQATVKFDDTQCTAQQLKQAVDRMGFELVIDQTDEYEWNLFANNDSATDDFCESTSTEDSSQNLSEKANSEKNAEENIAQGLNQDTQRTSKHKKAPKATPLQHDAKLKQMQRNAWGAMAVAIPLLVLGMVPHLFAGQEVASCFLAAFSLWKYGRLFYAPAWKLLKHGTSNMDTLVALSISVSFAYSFCNLFFPQWFIAHGMQPHLYFDSVGMITAFILLGRMLEARAKHRTTHSIRQLMQLQPQQVVCVFPNGKEITKHVKDVKPGDVLLARPGDRIAVDGVVTAGISNVDESSLSGEPIPVEKNRGSKVMAGTINKNGTLRYRAEKRATDTLLAQIVHMVQEAQGSKVPVQALVDRIAAVFVPTIIGIALITLLAWLLLDSTNGLTHGLVAMVSVLVIACPCSLGLATPTAIIVGIGRGAAAGILIKDAACLEVAEKINAVVLDKTGTITLGHPEVKAAWFESTAEAHGRSVLHALERQSEHPLAEAVCTFLKNETLSEVTHFTAFPGYGVGGCVDGQMYYAGSCKLMQEKNIFLTTEQQQFADDYARKACTIIALANESQVLALVALTDEVKSTSATAIQELKALGIETYMLTGDNAQTAAVVANEVGIDHYVAQTLPADKANFVKQLQAEGKKVAMVGDGINDSAALAVADLSVAMGRGSDIAIDTAMLTLLTSDLLRLPQAIRLSARTVRTIRQNLFWAFFYNVVSVPIAAGVLYPICGFMLSPIIAGAAMALSSVSVVTNSLRSGLKRI